MEINEIKNQLSIIQVLNHYGIEKDKNNRINCPFHEDKTPSMQVYEETNTVYCFSSNCKTHSKSLDVIDFIMYKENCSKHQAILKAQEFFQLTVDNGQLTMKKAIKINDTLSNQQIINKIFTYFKSGYTSRTTNKAKEYLKSRNLNVEKLQKLGIEIGYNSAQFHHRGKLSEEEKQAAIETGFLNPSTQGNGQLTNYSVWASNCVVFPLKDENGTITGMYARSTYENAKSKHFYLKNSKGLFHRPTANSQQQKANSQKLIITESIIDFLSLYQIDELRNNYEFLPIYGTNRLTEEHKTAIKNWLHSPSGEMSAGQRGKEIIFFLDGDEAGKKAVEKYAEILQNQHPNIKITNVETTENEDINSLLQGHDKEVLVHLINERKELIIDNGELKMKDVSVKIKSEKNAQISIDKPNPQTISKSSHSHIPTSSNSQTAKSQQQTANSQLNTNNPELLNYKTNELNITVLGGIRISGLDRLKVTLKVEKEHEINIIRHSLDLYNAKQTEQLIELINAQLEVSSHKAKHIIGNLTTELENYREKRLEALKPKAKETYKMTDKEVLEAVKYLKNKNLMHQTQKDIESCGIIGEHSNAMTGYIVNLSRKREKPLHVMYLGASGSGKTHLQEGLAQLVPEEDRIEATGLSDQSLYYEGLKLKGKIFFIEDLDGAENVMYIIRELQSKGKISKRVAWRDSKGNTKTIEVIAQGPVAISSCTTKERLYEDNANRCILLYIDQSKEQDQKVMNYMKEKSTGRIFEDQQEEIRHKMQNAQRMLRPIKVYNPYANLIDLPSEVFKPRRSLPLLLGFIESITFYHQYQREKVIKDQDGNSVEPYIQSTYEDIENGFKLMKNVLFSKSDELSKSSRDFLERLKKEVKVGETFYTKEIRKRFRLSSSGMHRYMNELKSYGYVKVKAGNRYRGFEYIIVDYVEYEQLRQGIENRLNAILQNIREISNPVSQSVPKH